MDHPDIECTIGPEKEENPFERSAQNRYPMSLLEVVVQRPRYSLAPPFSPLARVQMSLDTSKVVPAESPERAACEPERLGSKEQSSAEKSAKNRFSKENV
ncbi:hypothetical protein LAZ67_13000208 [Cordylochernes scorpioides]|uniref:Uncharacterized protein n=1 Tax=Cordylochernes scorpioides TaxID=51811 RepID=A0ABY6L7K1_9ARAC|nr:hypothetical protein LAZ67_13000208 [Cordylochernes scorpioides]